MKYSNPKIQLREQIVKVSSLMKKWLTNPIKVTLTTNIKRNPHSYNVTCVITQITRCSIFPLLSSCSAVSYQSDFINQQQQTFSFGLKGHSVASSFQKETERQRNLWTTYTETSSRQPLQCLSEDTDSSTEWQQANMDWTNLRPTHNLTRWKAEAWERTKQWFKRDREKLIHECLFLL